MIEDDSAPTQTDRLERLERLALIGHDIRTPLHTILGFSQLISSSDGAADNVQRWAALINVSGVELSLMIESLLRLGRIEANAEPSSLGPVDVCEVVEDVLASLVGTADAGGKVVRLELPSIRPLVFANHRDLTDAYIRLVHNAVRHSSGSEIVITVSPLPRRTTETTMVTTTIADDGVGFQSERLREFVGRFVRGANVAGVGLGLGLTIASHLIESCGGTLSYRNDDERPNTFSVCLQSAAPTPGTQAK